MWSSLNPPRDTAFSTLRESRGCETLPDGFYVPRFPAFSTLRESRGCETLSVLAQCRSAGGFQYSPRVEGV